MPIVSKRFGKNTLTTSPSTLATMTDEAGVGLECRLYSSHSAEVAVEIVADDLTIPLELPEGGSAIIRLPDLPDGAVITGSASVGAVVDYLITGGSQT